MARAGNRPPRRGRPDRAPPWREERDVEKPGPACRAPFATKETTQPVARTRTSHGTSAERMWRIRVGRRRQRRRAFFAAGLARFAPLARFAFTTARPATLARAALPPRAAFSLA